ARAAVAATVVRAMAAVIAARRRKVRVLRIKHSPFGVCEVDFEFTALVMSLLYTPVMIKE
ncbi:MAG: hypothetical protein Q4A66_12750, partial [Eubacteriales bacterium]|nr:hypothetical protein [Eubacteriales bacterium]